MEAYKISDQAHTSSGTFQRITEKIYNDYSSSFFIQLHGFDKKIGDPSVIMNNGVQNDTPLTDYLFALSQNLLLEDDTLDFKIAHIDLAWDRLLGTTNSPKSYSFTDDHNLTLNHNPNLNHLDYMLKQIDNDGTYTYSKIITVDLSTITDVDNEINYESELNQNYPNPFNPVTAISFTVPTPPKSSPLVKVRTTEGFVKLIVYNILGQQVATLVNEQKAPGNYEVQFDASILPSGIYFYKLTSGNFSQTKKLMLLK